jgi:hypothetical protein
VFARLSKHYRSDEAIYSCRNDGEVIRYILLLYPKWTDEGRELCESAGDRSGDVRYLLGGCGPTKDGRTEQFLDGLKEKRKPDMEAVKAIIRFLEKTDRLTYQLLAE